MVNESKSNYSLIFPVITEELLNFARSKPIKSVETVENAKRKNLQALIDKLNEFRYFLPLISVKTISPKKTVTD